MIGNCPECLELSTGYFSSSTNSFVITLIIAIIEGGFNSVCGKLLKVNKIPLRYKICATKRSRNMSKTTLNYWMMVERYPNLKEEVGSLIPSFEISSLLDKDLALACWPSVKKEKEKDLGTQYSYRHYPLKVLALFKITRNDK